MTGPRQGGKAGRLPVRPATEAGSAEEQPAKDTGVTDCDGRRGGPDPACRAAAFSQPPAGDCIGVVPCLRKPWGEATAGSRGVKPPSSNSTAAGRLAGGLPAFHPARPTAPPPSARVVQAEVSLPRAVTRHRGLTTVCLSRQPLRRCLFLALRA